MKILDIALKDMTRSFRSIFALIFMFGIPLLMTGMFYFMFGGAAKGGQGFSVPVTKVVVANLDAPNAEQADTLAYNLIASVLTMAMESIPIALAIYNHNGLIEVTKPENPRFALIKALNLSNDIEIYEPGKRFLAPPDLPRLRSTLTKLRNLDEEPARKLSQILNAEFSALKSAASDHPATAALKEVARYVSPPALIAVLSLSADDIEAFAVTLDGLKKRGYDSFMIETEREKRKAAAISISK